MRVMERRNARATIACVPEETEARPTATPRARPGLGRTITAGVLVVLFAILLPITTVTTWGHQLVLNTDRYISTVKPIASDPAVQSAAAREITNELFTALDVSSAVASALPRRALVLAGPITSGARDYIEQAVQKVLASSAFQSLWVEANRFAHGQLVSVLHGDTTVLKTTGGAIVLNLVPLLSAALQNAQGFVSQVVGRQVQIPTVTTDEPPAVACARIAAAIDRPLRSTCGEIPLFQAKNLAVAQRLVRAFDRGVVGLLIVTPLLFIGALLASRRRRRTLLQLSVSAVVGLVVVRRAVIWGRNELINTGRPENKDARAAIAHHVFNRFFDITSWMLIGALVLTAIALLTGPYGWAVATRRIASEVVSGIRASITGRQGSPQAVAAVAWSREHYDLLRYSGIAVAVILIAALDVNLIGLLVVLALLVAYEFGVRRLHEMRTPAHHAPT
jgi:hypothetical protein